MATKLFDSTIISETQEAMDFMAHVLEASTEYSVIGKGPRRQDSALERGLATLLRLRSRRRSRQYELPDSAFAAAVDRIRREAPNMEQKESLCAKEMKMKRCRSIKRALSAVLLSIALTLMLICSSWAQSTDVRRIGVLTPGGDFAPVLEGLRQGLVQLGYEDGKRVTFIVEDTKMETLDPVKAAMRLIATKPDLLVTVATSHTTAAKQVAGNIPIVFTMLTDPVQSGFVASYASSKNNLTGVSNNVALLSGKRLEVLKQIVPGIKRALAIVSVKESIAQKSFQFLAESANKFGVQLNRRDVTSKEELEKVLLDTPKGSVDAITLVPAILMRNHISLLVEKAIKDRIPLGVHTEELVKKGALVSYGEDSQLIGTQTARIVVKVLKGISPSEIPIETPERPVLAINLTTAKTIGVKIPREFLERVDRIVE